MSEAQHGVEGGAESEQRNPVEVLAEEFTERWRAGERPAIEDYCRAHPELATEIRSLFPALLAMEKVKPSSGSASGSGASLPPALERLGDYRLIREVGRGGMGIVYEAVQESLDRRVALKILPETMVLSAKRLERFRREAQAAARLHHSNVVPVFGVGEDGGFHYIVMQYIDGDSLDRVVASLALDGTDASPLLGCAEPQFGDAYWKHVAALGAQAAGALEYAHRHDTLHRDVKPGNLILDRQGVLWIADFGLAKLGDDTDAVTLTGSGDVVGTLRYMAPEQLDGQADARTDVYGLGLSLYELLTLRPAFVDRERAKLLQRIHRNDPEPPRSVQSAVPRDLETIIVKATAKDPRHRYADAGRLREDLERFAEGLPILARRVSSIERGMRWCRRNPGLATSSGVSLIALLVAAVVGWVAYGTTRDRLVEVEEARGQAQANADLSLAALARIFDALAEEERSSPERGRPSRPPEVSQKEAEVLQSITDFYEDFADLNETNEKLEREAARAYRRIGELHSRLRRSSASDQAFARALEMTRRLIERQPDGIENRLEFAGTVLAQGRRVGLVDPTRHEERLHDALWALDARSHAADPRLLLARARVEGELALLAEARDDVELAEEHFEECLDALAQREQRGAIDPELIHERGRRRLQYSGLLRRTDRAKEGKALLTAATNQLWEYLEPNGTRPRDWDLLARAHRTLGRWCGEDGDSDGAAREFERASQARRRADANRPPGRGRDRLRDRDGPPPGRPGRRGL